MDLQAVEREGAIGLFRYGLFQPTNLRIASPQIYLPCFARYGILVTSATVWGRLDLALVSLAGFVDTLTTENSLGARDCDRFAH